MAAHTDRHDSQLAGGQLLDRDTERTAIERAVEQLAAGQSGLIVIEGNAGTGKTSLLNRVVASGRRHGTQVLIASGSQGEREMLLGLGGQLFDLSAGPDPAIAQLGPQWPGNVLAETFISLHRRIAQLATAGPLVIAVDDLHLVDDLSLRWLGYLSRRLADLPAILAITIPTGEIRSGTRLNLMADLRNSLDALTLRPAPLNAADVTTALGTQLPGPVPEAFGAVCHTMTGGNPLLVNELCQLLSQENIDPASADLDDLRRIGPPSIAQYVLSRAQRLSPTAPPVARAIAVLGSADPALIAAMCTIDEEAATDIIAGLSQLGIVRSTPPISFVHPVVRNALRENMRSAERQRYHRKAAELLANRGGAAAEVAQHLLATTPTMDPATVEVLCRIAVELISQGEHALGADCLERAMQGSMSPTHRGRLALTLGATLAAYDPQGAIAHLRHASSVVKQPDQINVAHRALGHTLASNGQLLEAIDVFADGAEQLERVRPDLAAQSRESRLLLSLLHADTVGSASETIVADTAASVGSLPLTRFLHPVAAATRNCWSGLDRTGTVRQLQRALTDGTLPTTCPMEYTAALLPLIHADRLDLADRHLELLTGEDNSYAAEAATLRSIVALVKGDVRVAVDQARQAVGVVTAGGGVPLFTDQHAALVAGLIELGEQDEAATIIGRTGLVHEIPLQWRYNDLLEVRGRLRVLGGELHAGLADLMECGRRLQLWGADNPAVNGWRCTAALALYRIGDREKAVRLADEQLSAAQAWGSYRALGQSLRTRALVDDDPGARIDRLAESVAQLRNSPAALDLGRSLVDLGSAMTARSTPRPARELLREGLDIAQRSGATQLAAHAHRELVNSGARPRRRAQSGRDALTSAELRTATLAASGSTNRQIAQTLFVTQRTIELHLTNAYRKLQVRNRAELGRVLDTKTATGLAQ